MNDILVSHYKSSEVRTVELNGEPWFVLKDVCAVLGISHITDTAKRMDEDEVGQTEVIDSVGRKQSTYVINESGLYNVIMRSDKPEAKPFRKWVTSEVLPSIRKHGAYMTPQKIEEARLNPDTIISLAQQLKEEKAKTAKLAPAAEYAQDFLLASGGRLVSSIAKDYGMSAQRFNRLLNALDIQYRKGGQ